MSDDKKTGCSCRSILYCTIFILAIICGSISDSFGWSRSSKNKELIPFKLNALLISLEDYEYASLNYVKNDLEKLSRVLQFDYGCTATLIYNKYPTDNTDSDQSDYAKTSIEKQITQWCSRLTEDDIAILYLSGHGIKNSEGKLYFPMLNFKNPKLEEPFREAAIPVSWIRDQFVKAKCKSRIVFIDTCYSGTDKDFEQASELGTYDLARSFNESDNEIPVVTTIASSDKDQKSWLWSAEKHSLFTYWLIEALRGGADTGKDGFIDLDELYNFLKKHVTRISQNNSIMKLQTPVLLNGHASENYFVLPRPIKKLDEALDDVFQSIDARLRNNKLFKILVAPEFKTGGTGDTIDSFEYGLLPVNIAESVRTHLAVVDEYDEKPYSVVQKEQARFLLEKLGLAPRDIGTDKDLLLKQKEEIDAVIDGSIRLLSDHNLLVNLTLKNLKNEDFNEYCFKVHLSKEELIAMGVAFKQQNQQKEQESFNFNYVTTEEGIVKEEQWEQTEEINRQRRNHYNPMTDSSLPFQIKIGTRPAGSTGRNYKIVHGKIHEGTWYIPLKKNDEFGIFITNNDSSSKFCFVKVLVDGLNTVSQEMPTISTNVSADKSSSQYILPADSNNIRQTFAPRVSLEKARAYLLFGPNQKYSNRLDICGFLDEKGNKSKGYRFLLGDAAQSLAERQHYTEKIGLITIAFYQAVSNPKMFYAYTPAYQQLATTMGDQFDVKMKVYQGNETVGDLKVVYQIRYVSQEEFDNL